MSLVSNIFHEFISICKSITNSSRVSELNYILNPDKFGISNENIKTKIRSIYT